MERDDCGICSGTLIMRTAEENIKLEQERRDKSRELGIEPFEISYGKVELESRGESYYS